MTKAAEDPNQDTSPTGKAIIDDILALRRIYIQRKSDAENLLKTGAITPKDSMEGQLQLIAATIDLAKNNFNNYLPEESKTSLKDQILSLFEKIITTAESREVTPGKPNSLESERKRLISSRDGLIKSLTEEPKIIKSLTENDITEIKKVTNEVYDFFSNVIKQNAPSTTELKQTFEADFLQNFQKQEENYHDYEEKARSQLSEKGFDSTKSKMYEHNNDLLSLDLIIPKYSCFITQDLKNKLSTQLEEIKTEMISISGNNPNLKISDRVENLLNILKSDKSVPYYLTEQDIKKYSETTNKRLNLLSNSIDEHLSNNIFEDKVFGKLRENLQKENNIRLSDKDFNKIKDNLIEATKNLPKHEIKESIDNLKDDLAKNLLNNQGFFSRIKRFFGSSDLSISDSSLSRVNANMKSLLDSQIIANRHSDSERSIENESHNRSKVATKLISEKEDRKNLSHAQEVKSNTSDNVDQHR